MKTNNLKKIALTFFTLFLLISCQSKKQNQEESILYYKFTNLNDDTFSYAIRKYEHKNDTIIEKYILLNKKGDISEKHLEGYVKLRDSLFILSNVANDNSKYFFFSFKSKKDSCNIVQMPLDAYKVCYRGYRTQNFYEVYIETITDHPQKDIFLFDKDYHVITKNDIRNNTKEEVITDSKVINSIKDKFNQVSKTIKWW